MPPPESGWVPDYPGLSGILLKDPALTNFSGQRDLVRNCGLYWCPGQRPCAWRRACFTWYMVWSASRNASFTPRFWSGVMVVMPTLAPA